jgi:soluble lytic murein transglycosylase-like protein
MTRFRDLSLFTALAAAIPAASGSEACDLALLRNGFTIQYARRESAGASTRLWVCAGAGEGYLEVPSDQIEGYEQPPRAVPLAPEAPSVTVVRAPRIPLGSVIERAASRHGIDPDFVASVVRAESGFDPAAESPKGALGLMQLMPQTAAGLGVKDALDPSENVEGGTRYLRQLLDRYDGDAVKALAAYNAGPQRVEQYGGIPPYRETFAFVSRIINDYNRKKLSAATPRPAP